MVVQHAAKSKITVERPNESVAATMREKVDLCAVHHHLPSSLASIEGSIVVVEAQYTHTHTHGRLDILYTRQKRQITNDDVTKFCSCSQAQTT